MRNTIRDMLIEGGHDVVGEATNGLEGVLLCKKHSPSVITLDLHMPYMDGLEATNMIATAFPSSKIVMVSTENEKQKIMKALMLGASSYILKPFDKEKLLTSITQACENKNKRPQNAATMSGGKKIDVSTLPYYCIQKKDNVHYVWISPNIFRDSINELQKDIERLCLIKPLLVAFDFANCATMTDLVLAQLVSVAHSIRIVGGTCKMLAQDKNFVKNLMEKQKYFKVVHYSVDALGSASGEDLPSFD
jgi:two-component system chemotaxis response regulator CheY